MRSQRSSACQGPRAQFDILPERVDAAWKWSGQGSRKCVPRTSVLGVESTFTIQISYVDVVGKQTTSLVNKSAVANTFFKWKKLLSSISKTRWWTSPRLFFLSFYSEICTDALLCCFPNPLPFFRNRSCSFPLHRVPF